MAHELDALTTEIENTSDLERQLTSVDKVPEKKESFWHKAGDIALYVSDLYFKPKSFEQSGKVYEALGVKRFKKFMFNGDYMAALVRKADPDYKLINSWGSAGLWEQVTRLFESIHVGFGGVILFDTIDCLADGDYKRAAVGAAINTVVNIYPIMLQRYNRARIYKVLGRKQRMSAY
ncbi:MAG: hypothetical protein AABW48_01675 [Nanoarchaeota archaeon]